MTDRGGVLGLFDDLVGGGDDGGDVGGDFGGGDTAAAGNGGTADASASGGAVSIDDINSGGNTGSAISAGDVFDGAVAIDGGEVLTDTSLDISADGGTAISDASGGDGNFAFVS